MHVWAGCACRGHRQAMIFLLRQTHRPGSCLPISWQFLDDPRPTPAAGTAGIRNNPLSSSHALCSNLQLPLYVDMSLELIHCSRHVINELPWGFDRADELTSSSLSTDSGHSIYMQLVVGPWNFVWTDTAYPSLSTWCSNDFSCFIRRWEGHHPIPAAGRYIQMSSVVWVYGEKSWMERRVGN